MFDDPRMNETYPMLSAFSAPLSKPARQIIGRDKEKLSLMSSLSRPELCNAILLAPAGTGKAHPNDELIAVDDPRGYIRVGLLSVGDRVFGEDGEPVEVSGLFPQGRKREYVVWVNDRERVRCNDEHLWTVRDLSVPESLWQTLTLRQIMDAGLVMKDGLPRWQLPPSKAVTRISRSLPLHPYVMGALLGWGARIDDNDAISLPDQTPDEVFALIEAQMGWQRQRCVGWGRSVLIDSLTGLRVSKKHVMTHPVLTSVFIKEPYLRRVPHTYLTSSIADRSDMLRALRESAQYRQHMEETEERAWLIDVDLYELERSLDVEGDCITGVEDTGRDVEMTCLMVDSSTHLYQVGRGYVVTHNTALVQACMVEDTERIYLEVDLARMIANLSNPEEMASRLKTLFDEAEQFSKTEAHELVLFIDEFHQVVQLSSAAVEALKPLLAASGVRGIKVIAATTYDEFNAHIASNLPLVERLARINIPPTNREVTIEILKGMAKRYGVDDQIWNDSLYAQIYEYTNRYVPASVQPRKSIRVLDAMVGRHRYTGERMDKRLLATVLKTEFDVEVEINVDATEIKRRLDARVFSQDFATTTIARRLQLCVAGLNDPGKPMSSLLFTGATGTGKACADDTMVPVWTEDGSVAWKRHGDLVVGDYVFARDGSPTKVLGVFPQKEQPFFRVTLLDGRSLDVGQSHLWGVYKRRQNWIFNDQDDWYEPGLSVMSTQDMFDSDEWEMAYADGKLVRPFCIPVAGPVQWESDGSCDDIYAEGLMLGQVGSYGDDAESSTYREKREMVRRIARSGESQRRALLRGVCDSTFDELWLDDDLLAYDMKRIAWSLGYVVEDLGWADDDEESWLYGLRLTSPQMVPIVSITRIADQTSQCIYVDHPEHLYQAGDFIVTHNTEVTKQLAQILFGDDQRHLVRFDMSEWGRDESVDLFREELARQVWATSHCILLFDEIEKASPLVTRLLLQVLDDGRLSDKDGRQVSFLNTYIVLTTNAGSEIYRTIGEYSADDSGSEEVMKEYEKIIQTSIKSAGGNRFPPELLGRIDAIVPFQPLARSTLRTITMTKLRAMVQEVMRKHGVRVHVDKRVVDFLVEDESQSDSDAGGARDMVRRMARHVTTEVAAFINEHPEEREIGVRIEGVMRSEDESILKSSARVVVQPYDRGRMGSRLESARV